MSIYNIQKKVHFIWKSNVSLQSITLHYNYSLFFYNVLLNITMEKQFQGRGNRRDMASEFQILCFKKILFTL